MTSARTHKANTRPRRPGDPPSAKAIALCAILLVVLLASALAAISWGFSTLGEICDEQCIIRDTETDVAIETSGKMVTPSIIAEIFGLTNGANLARIDFARIRTNLIKHVPVIRDLRVERRRPNRVTVNVIEREPIARMGSLMRTRDTDHVTDGQGMVFNYKRRTASLPIIREPDSTSTPVGQTLSGRSLAALHLVKASGDPEFAALGIMEIDTSKADYLLITLGGYNYTHAKIAWDDMGEDTTRSRTTLKRQLKRLSMALATRLAPRSTLWIATNWGDNGRVYANNPTREN